MFIHPKLTNRNVLQVLRKVT